MSCKHEFIRVCVHCTKTQTEIDLEAQLAAAYQDLTAQDMLIQEAKKGAAIMEQQLAAAETALSAESKRLNESLKREADSMIALAAERADHEKAETELLNHVVQIDSLLVTEKVKREQAEASCAAMRGALEYYAGGAKYVQRPDGKVPISDDGGAIARAALSASSSAPAGEDAP